MSHGLEAVWALCWRELLRFARERSALYATLARPLLWLVFLGSGMRSAFQTETGVPYGAFMLPGVIAMTILFGGLFSGVSTIWDREVGFLKEVLVAPVGRFYVAGGKLLAGTLVTSLQALITLAFAPLVGVSIDPGAALPLLGVILLTSAGVVGVGLAIAAFLDSFEGFSNLTNFVALPLFFLSGSMYPVDQVPGWLSPAVQLNPMTYAVDAMRQLAVGVAHKPLSVDLAVLAGFCAVATSLSTLAFRRQ